MQDNRETLGSDFVARGLQRGGRRVDVATEVVKTAALMVEACDAQRSSMLYFVASRRTCRVTSLGRKIASVVVNEVR